MNLEVFKNLLKQTQMQIYTAESGKECLEVLKQETFDLIFLDHMMPEMDGIETFCEIQNNKLCEEVPIIMLTANALIGDREKYIKQGFKDFVSKPIIPKKLDKIILQYLPKELIIFEDNSEKRYEDLIEEEKNEEVYNYETKENELIFDSSNRLDELKQRISEIDFETGLMMSGEDESFYLELLDFFTKLPMKNELTQYLSDMNNKDYCIRVHGFKNSAYSIGAKELGDLAYELEKLTKEGFSEKVYVLQEDLFGRYDEICDKYNEIISNG